MLRSMAGYFRRNVVGFLALFVALGGTAYAVNTVGSSDIIDGQVKSVDVGDNEINSADVKDQSLSTFDVHTFLGVDVVDNTLTGDDIQESSLGQVPSAANSGQLDGIDSTGFVRGGGSRRTYVTQDDITNFPNETGAIHWECSLGQHRLRFRTGVGSAFTVWTDIEGTVNRVSTPSGDDVFLGNPNFVAGNAHIVIRASGSDGFRGEWDVMVVSNGTDFCEWNVTEQIF
jgi:hypothetical protein